MRLRILWQIEFFLASLSGEAPRRACGKRKIGKVPDFPKCQSMPTVPNEAERQTLPIEHMGEYVQLLPTIAGWVVSGAAVLRDVKKTRHRSYTLVLVDL